MDSEEVQFTWGLRVTGIIVGGLGVLSTVGGISSSTAPLYELWAIGLGAWLVAILVAVVALLARWYALASGVIIGMGVGLLMLTVTCFVNLSTGAFG